MLKHIKKLMGKDIHEMFDVICGTSTGAIIAASIGIRRKSVEECEKLYRELIGKVFCKGPMATPKMVLTRAYYDSKILESVLQRECGKGVFIDSTAEEGMPKVCVVSSKLGTSDVTCHTFRNYTYPVGSESRFAGTPDAQLWEALRASSAAPTFFTEKLLNGTLHADGAIVANNPTAVAIHEAQSIFPGIPIELVVSMGNGLAEPKFVDLWKEGSKDKQLGWYDILDSYIYAAVQTEDVHHMLVELLPPEKYFRFNPKTRCAGIDEVRPEKLVEMVDDANRYIEASGERFRRLSEILKPRGMRHFWNQISYAIGMEVRYVQNLFDPVFREEEVATES
uniref:PNPLA domain-containing protein n=3 Tax=Rhodosorus marinus TaxID=101924 RepID=A0A7S3EP51_9RHOD|mmetsp:Transcript_6157/g.26055  ORF Transcript_6157/g.26055 Transcript_6157/m.26055 type:complete len:337 (+) Transcript_6157:354-1364(+)